MMSSYRPKRGFSLTEVLLAVGTLAVGMLFIAGVFPVAIHFTTVSAERTIAASVADEAFAKIKLYGVDLADANFSLGAWPFENVALTRPVPAVDFTYPTLTTANIADKRYFWTAMCGRTGPRDVQVTVFVCRKAGAGATYHGVVPARPTVMAVAVNGAIGGDQLTVTPFVDGTIPVNDGYTLIDGATGLIYRVLERHKENNFIITLDRPWQGANPPVQVWTIPPPRGGGRNPCIAVYQKVMRF